MQKKQEKNKIKCDLPTENTINTDRPVDDSGLELEDKNF